MIAQENNTVVHLGGWRGDQLRLSEDGGPFRLLAELGWDAGAQVTPQRRMLVRGDDIFVLEPRESHLIRPPFRVRRFSLAGEESGREQEEVEGEAALAYHARREGTASWSVRRGGIDADTGRPTAAEDTVAAEMTRRDSWDETTGTPLHHGDTWWYPVRARGLYGVSGRGTESIPGEPSPPQLQDGRVVCAGHRKKRQPGLWIDGVWNRLPGRLLFPRWRTPPGPLVGVRADGGLFVLRREGGKLPVPDGGRAPSLPEGIYSSLVTVGNRTYGVREGAAPELVPVEF